MDNIFTNLEGSPVRQTSNNSLFFDFCKTSPIFKRFQQPDVFEPKAVNEKQKQRVIRRLEPDTNFDSDQISFQVSEQNFSESSSALSKKMNFINHIDLKDMVSKCKKRKSKFSSLQTNKKLKLRD